MAGVAGFEPANAGVKVPCLTAWRHPKILSLRRFVLAPLSGKSAGLGLAPNPASSVGWVKGLEPSTPGTTIRCSNQLSYTHQIHGVQLKRMARQKGFEPLAYCLEGSCSIRLSYWRVFGAGDGNRTRIPSLEGWCPGHCATPAFRAARSFPPQQTVSLKIVAWICRFVKSSRPIFQKFCLSDPQGDGRFPSGALRRTR